MPDPSEHRVIGPDGQLVFAPGCQFLYVVQSVFLKLIVVAVRNIAAYRGIHPPNPFFHVRDGYDRQRSRTVTSFVNPEYGMEDLSSHVRVHGRVNFGYEAEICVDEFAQPDIVLHCADSRSAGYKEFESRYAEGILAVHQEQADPECIHSCGVYSVFRCPRFCLSLPQLVRDPPDLPDLCRVKVLWNGKRRCLFHGKVSFLSEIPDERNALPPE